MSALDRLKAVRTQLPARYARARPIKHLILEDFLDRELYDDLLLEFPPIPDGENELVTTDVRAWGKAFRTLDALLASPEVSALMADISGTPGLVVDPAYVGAGVRHTRAGAQMITPPSRLNGGWGCQLGMVINLSPAWRETFGERTLLASARANVTHRATLFQPALDQPLTLRASDAHTGRAIHAYFFAHERRAVSRAPAAAARETVVPAAPPLRQGFGRTLSSYEADLGELRRAVEARWQRIDHLLSQTRETSATFLATVERSFRDVTTLMPADELAACLALLQRQDAVLAALTAGSTTADLERTRALPALPVEGALSLVSHEGAWRDRWVSTTFDAVVRPARPIQRLIIRGMVPSELGRRQHLTATIDGAIHQKRMDAGGFEWTLPLPRASAAPVHLQVVTLHAWRPSDSGHSPDGRELAWHLVALAAE
jgi:hypothetical protein